MPPSRKQKPNVRPKRPRIGAKPTQIGIRFTSEDRELIERAADSANLSLSDWGRLAMVAAARKQLGEESDGE